MTADDVSTYLETIFTVRDTQAHVGPEVTEPVAIWDEHAKEHSINLYQDGTPLSIFYPTAKVRSGGTPATSCAFS